MHVVLTLLAGAATAAMVNARAIITNPATPTTLSTAVASSIQPIKVIIDTPIIPPENPIVHIIIEDAPSPPDAKAVMKKEMDKAVAALAAAFALSTVAEAAAVYEEKMDEAFREVVAVVKRSAPDASPQYLGVTMASVFVRATMQKQKQQ